MTLMKTILLVGSLFAVTSLSADETVRFLGGASDGFDSIRYLSAYTQDASPYRGGFYDGYHADEYNGFDTNGSYLTGQIQRVSGGANDGFALYTLHSDYSQTTFPFHGGSFDGHSNDLYQNFDIDQNYSYAEQVRVAGGPNDGHAFAQDINFLNPPLNHRFAGGTSDGYSDFIIYDIRLKILHPRFLGGGYDGTAQAIVYEFPHPTLLDNDQDLMLDLWEILTFGAIETASHKTNADGDVTTDQQEYLHGTDPFNPQSNFSILDYLLKRDRSCSFAFATTPGKKYTLLISNGLTQKSWSPVDGYKNISGSPLRIIEVKLTLPYDACYFKILIEDE